jgi:hypothetical protein
MAAPISPGTGRSGGGLGRGPVTAPPCNILALLRSTLPSSGPGAARNSLEQNGTVFGGRSGLAGSKRGFDECATNWAGEGGGRRCARPKGCLRMLAGFAFLRISSSVPPGLSVHSLFSAPLAESPQPFRSLFIAERNRAGARKLVLIVAIRAPHLRQKIPYGNSPQQKLDCHEGVCPTLRQASALRSRLIAS